MACLYPVSTTKLTEKRTLEVFMSKVTMAAVQQLLRSLSHRHGANPDYLFIAEQDYPGFNDSAGGLVTCFTNEKTGKTVYVVPLPEMRAGSVMCGFF